ncbi:MAG: hypothetical protein OSA98_20020 [Rubripirellula sp.]|nr:hypothetical protein [Rubripirellula sp.]
MKQMLQALLWCLLVASVGCNRSSTPAIPPTAGDFVMNNFGVGTAQVFGIDFRVNVAGSGASTEWAINISFTDATKSSARKRFTIGDDIVIQLDSISESEVKFIFNDQNFDNLNVGDHVVIDDEQNVEVNGESRLPKPAN